MQDPDFDEVRASARLPRLDIDIVHRRSRDGDAELMTITMRAVPGFEGFEQMLQAANPFQFWLRAAELAWAPWLQATRQLLQQPGGETASESDANRPRLPGPKRR